MQTYENEEMIVPVNAIYAIAQGSQGPMPIVSCFNKNANYKNYVSLSHSTIAAKGCGSWEVDRGRGLCVVGRAPWVWVNVVGSG